MEHNSLMSYFVIYICGICFVNHVLFKNFLSNEMVVYYFDYYDAFDVILNMTFSTPDCFRRSGFGV